MPYLQTRRRLLNVPDLYRDRLARFYLTLIVIQFFTAARLLRGVCPSSTEKYEIAE
jgi:hypothetical protein